MNKSNIIASVIIVLAVVFTDCQAQTEQSGGYRALIKTKPFSHLQVYKGEKLIYRFAPIVPNDVGYPRRLVLEKAQIVGQYIVTSWGETGADYWGTHPILIKINDSSCKAVDCYEGELSQDERIKDYSWIHKDFEVENYFEPREKVKTILTQGVSVTADNELEFSFYADEKPHAEEHSFVKIKTFQLSE